MLLDHRENELPVQIKSDILEHLSSLRVNLRNTFQKYLTTNLILHEILSLTLLKRFQMNAKTNFWTL